MKGSELMWLLLIVAAPFLIYGFFALVTWFKLEPWVKRDLAVWRAVASVLGLPVPENAEAEELRGEVGGKTVSFKQTAHTRTDHTGHTSTLYLTEIEVAASTEGIRMALSRADSAPALADPIVTGEVTFDRRHALRGAPRDLVKYLFADEVAEALGQVPSGRLEFGAQQLGYVVRGWKLEPEAAVAAVRGFATLARRLDLLDAEVARQVPPLGGPFRPQTDAEQLAALRTRHAEEIAAWDELIERDYARSSRRARIFWYGLVALVAAFVASLWIGPYFYP